LPPGQISSNVLVLDFETYYDSKKGYTLKKQSMLEYIKDPRFKAFGAGVRGYGVGKATSEWIPAARLEAFLHGMDWSKTTLCAQNTKFDGAILAWRYGIVPRAYIDTKSMAAALLGTLIKDNSLATIAAHFGLAPKGFLPTDGVETLTPEKEVELADYCLHDTDLCWEIYQRLLPQFPPSQFWAVDWTIRRFISPKLVLDGPKLKELNESEKVRKAKIFEAIKIEKSTFTSNDKFAALLKERGFEVPMKKSPTALKKGETEWIPALAVGDSDFKDMLESENEELVALCEARVAAKSNILETRSAKYLKLVDMGPWPFDMNFSGAKQTHRYSGASGGGGNPQNLTRKSALRGAVCAPSGHKLGVADFAGIELRIASWLACELKLMSAISEGRDVYSEFASKIYNRTITKADLVERQFGKCCILGLGYGMGWEKFIYTVRLQTGMVIDEDKAREVVDLYRNTYDRIRYYWNTLDRMINILAEKRESVVPNATFLKIHNGEIILPSGLPLRYPNLRVDGTEWVYDIWRNGHKETTKLYGGKLLENICQALAGEVTKVAIERAEASGIFCAGQVHDEIIAVFSAERAEIEAAKLRNAMEAPMPWWPVLKLNAEIGVGPNWLEAKA
jgi:DNA polymerase